MTAQLTRREFARAGVAATLGLAAGGTEELRAASADRGSASRLKVGLHSITYTGLWYEGEPLSPEEVLRRAKRYGYCGVDMRGTRPHACPVDMPAKRCATLRKFAADQGVEIYAISVTNDFSSPIPELREAQLLYVRDCIRMAADLGAGIVRVFAAWAGSTRHPRLARYDIANRIWEESHRDFSQEEIWTWCREGLAESARIAGDCGIILALQNHPPLIKDQRDILRMVREVDSPHLKVCLDAMMLPDKNNDITYQAGLEVRGLQVLSHFGGQYERDLAGRVTLVKGAKNQPAFVRAMREIGYEGYFGYELCHPVLAEGRAVSIDYVDRNAELACEYHKALIAEVM